MMMFFAIGISLTQSCDWHLREWNGANGRAGSWKKLRRNSGSCSRASVEHHKRAAEHLTLAAHHHGEAAKHYDAGAHEKAAHHAHIARGHAILARGHAEEAVKAHVEEHGKK
jgi:hypothetical protein